MRNPNSAFLSLLLGALTLSFANGDDADRRIDFSRDVQPILSDTCFKCHGPDANQRVSELRLDTKAGAFGDLDGLRPIVPNKPLDSELHRRVTSDDAELRMPPADSGLNLSAEQVRVLTEWIEQGATWQDHWAFVTPVTPQLPLTRDQSWRINPIDDFVMDRLEREQLRPSPEADRARLIRRVTLDLTGLPPTIAEVDEFLNDQSERAYERVVDRLLSSPRYGERMAVQWLDAARYADTSGYQNDGPRDMWRWRDWVIDAFNRNLPYDEFTIQQLAGDLLPDATLDQRIATGFNRNHRGNAEGGIIPAEYQVEYVVDRVDTTATVWLGLTLGCARCHDHKYDPISQKEFYRFFAYFNNVPEHGRAIKEGNSPPYVVAPTSDQQQQLTELRNAVANAERRVAELRPALETAQADWERNATVKREALTQREASTTEIIDNWFDADGLIAHFESNTATESEVGDVADFGYFDKFSIACRARPEQGDGTLVSRMTPVDQGDGYYLDLEDGRVQFNLVKRWLDDSIRVETERRLEPGRRYHITATYDGSRRANGIRIYIDGQAQKLRVGLDGLNQTFAVQQPLRIGNGQRPFRGTIDDVRVYDRDLSAAETAMLATSSTISELLAVPPTERTPGQADRLRAYFLEHTASVDFRDAHRQLRRLTAELRAFKEQLPTVMVMEELETPRETFVLVRGQYDKPGERVTTGVPAVFPPLPKPADGGLNNRLTLARWLVDPANPLTSRVAANRFWQLHFGTGLVVTTEDFGVQGERPSHPKLLDWLATEFMRSGWNMKHVHKLIVMSAAYRQSSRANADLLARDPDNRLLARGPRIRLDAETLRDQALAVSGLLTVRIGGPSVRPYQPAGLWEEIATDTEYKQSHGEDLYCRSLYTYWKRTVAPPMMATFDASSREACTVRRSRTNTPLQALALMNDITFVEAARVLAQTAMQQPGDERRRIEFAFRTATARRPRNAELHVLLNALRHAMDEFAADPNAATELVSTGEAPRDNALPVSELAAYTTVASLILNMDSVITRE